MNSPALDPSASECAAGSTPSSAPVTALAWRVVMLLWPVAALNYLDRQMIATMRKSIRADIPSIASDEQFAYLMALFMWAYAFLSPAGGFVADRFNRRRTVILSLGVWSAVTWLTGHATTFEQMAWARALMGVSEACYIPAAMALIAEFHPGLTRSRAIGIHISGIYAGQALGGVGGHIADTSSWRNAFYWFGLAGVVYAVVLVFFLKDAPKGTGPNARAEPPLDPVITLKHLLGIGSFLILILCFTLPSIPGWAVKNWLPSHLATAFGLEQGPAGLSATGYVTIASFFGALLGGGLADAWMRRTIRGRIYVSSCGTFLCVPALLGLGYAANLQQAIAFMILFGLGFGMLDANNMPILCQVVGHRYRATAYGLMNLVGISTGAGVTVILGRMRDHHIPLSSAFILSAAVATLSALAVLCIRPRNPRDLER